MMSRKWMVGLMAVVLMLALAPSSFAQVEIRLFNTPAAQEVNTDRHVRTADIGSTGSGLLVSGVLVANSTLTTTTLTLTFPAAITTSPLFPATGTDNIRIEGATGVFATAAISTTTTTTIVLTLPGFPPPAGNQESGSFRLTGIRLNGSGLATPAVLTSASLSSSANNYIAPTSMPTLVTATAAGLGAVAAGPAITGTGALAPAGGVSSGNITIFTNQVAATPSDDNASMTIAEGFASAWRTSTQGSVNGLSTGLSGVGIRLTVSGIPTSMGVTVFVQPPTAPAVTAVTGCGVALTSASTAASQCTLTFSATDIAAVESLNLSFVITGAPTAALTPGAITVVATLAPVAATTGAAGTSPFTAAPIPKFVQADTAAYTIGAVVTAKTTLLVPYAVSIGTGGSTYNTGIAVANTTRDPFTLAGGGAIPTDGTMSFYLFQRSATGFAGTSTVTTSATVQPGTGLSATGAVVSGGLWAGLLSQVLAAQTTLTGDFFGYVFIDANFLNAHGTAYLLTGGVISSGLPISVLPPPAVTSRVTAGAGGEQLGF